MVLGFFLWLLGWYGHRFWIVLFTTVIAGVVGLASARVAGVQPFVAGLLLAIAAGTLALSLSRLLGFWSGRGRGLVAGSRAFCRFGMNRCCAFSGAVW